MLRHYLSSSLRHFRRHKVTTSINVVCLALGLACFAAIHAGVTYLKGGDRYLPDSHLIFAITQKTVQPGSNFSIPTGPSTGGVVAQYLKADYPEYRVARARQGVEASVATSEVKTSAFVSYVDPEFLQIFELDFVAGAAASALRGAREVVLTEETAKRLFGSARAAVGRSLRLENDADVTVTGVIGAVPQPSHMGATTYHMLQFDMLASLALFESGAWAKQVLQRWNTPMVLTYVRLPDARAAATLQENLRTFAARHVPKNVCECEFGAITLGEVPLARFDGLVGADDTGLSTVELLYALGAMVLLVSCLNYTNLANALVLTRTKEIGLRRVVGANRIHVIGEYAFESIFFVLAAAVLMSVVLAASALLGSPALARALVEGVVLNADFWIALCITWAVVSAIAASYPAFTASRLRPAQVVRSGRIKSGTGIVSTALVAAQFGAASFLLIVLVVIYGQGQELKRAALRSIEDPVIVIDRSLITTKIDGEVLRAELMKHPGVKSVSTSGTRPWWNLSCTQEMVASGAAAGASRWATCGNSVGHDFFATVQMKLLAGEDFQRDGNNEGKVVIDTGLARQYGWTNPGDAVGRTVYWGSWIDQSQPASTMRVIGVVESRPLAPLGLGATTNMYSFAPWALWPLVRVSGADVAGAVAHLESTWKKLSPDVALRWRFGEEVLNGRYTLFRIAERIVGAISLLALFIAVLGLIGMSMHVIRSRTHEIGVRKTLGATTIRVLVLLLRDFSRPIVIANVLAWPLAFIAAQSYLDVFIHRMQLSPLPFALSLAATVLVACIAVVAQATRAARIKPATVLRYE